VGLGRASSADALRLLTRLANEHPTGNRGLCCDIQRTRFAAALSGQTTGAYDTIYQVTESTHFANAALWAATNQRCGNEAFNITNGDYFRWRNLWPKIAAVFEMPVAEPQTICLTQHMADKGALWQEITVRHKLKRIPYMDLVAWPFADYVFGADWDVMSE
jgi:hypothetical protein